MKKELLKLLKVAHKTDRQLAKDIRAVIIRRKPELTKETSAILKEPIVKDTTKYNVWDGSSVVAVEKKEELELVAADDEIRTEQDVIDMFGSVDKFRQVAERRGVDFGRVRKVDKLIAIYNSHFGGDIFEEE